jgi:MFS family permease
MWALARIRDCRLLFAGLMATMVGDLLLTLMLAVWVRKLAGSNSAAGITLGCAVIASALSPLLAWPVDRFRRRPFVVTANVVTAAIIVPLLIVHRSGQVWVIYAVAAVYSTFSVITSAASQGLIGKVVPVASIPDAYGALQTAQQALRVFVPVVGVVLYSRMGSAMVVVMTIVALVTAGAAIFLIRAPESRPEPVRRRWVAEVTAGARQLAGDRVLARLTIGCGITMVAAGAFAVINWAVVTKELGKPAAFISVFVSVQAATAIIGALVSARTVKRFGELTAASISIGLAAVGILLTAVPSVVAVGGGYALAGFAGPIAGVSAYSAAQRRIPAELFGKTIVALTSAVSLPQALAIPAAAAMLSIVGFRTLILACFAIVTIAAAYLWLGRALTRPSRQETPAAGAEAEVPVSPAEAGAEAEVAGRPAGTGVQAVPAGP